MTLILASSSPYRKQLLERLHIHADCIAPNIDESALAHEAPRALALRLAINKANAIAQTLTNSQSIVIGSDQVASLDGAILGKPHTSEQAIAQLQKQSGRCVVFYTAVCVQNHNLQLTEVIATQVVFRVLSLREIENYIAIESPLDCAGSFKCEGLGITLFEKITSDDPSALIGLPLIKTAEFLRALGINPLHTKA